MSATDDMLGIIPIAIGAGLVMKISDRMLGDSHTHRKKKGSRNSIYDLPTKSRSGKGKKKGNPFKSSGAKYKQAARKTKIDWMRPF